MRKRKIRLKHSYASTAVHRGKTNPLAAGLNAVRGRWFLTQVAAISAADTADQ